MNGWIVCYVLRNKHTERDTDHYEVFINDGEKCRKKAKKRFLELSQGGKYKEFKSNIEVYSVNLCHIKNSTEATYLNIPI